MFDFGTNVSISRKKSGKTPKKYKKNAPKVQKIAQKKPCIREMTENAGK